MNLVVYIIFYFLLICQEANSQNLVKNGSFEEGDCPEGLNNNHILCAYWAAIGSGDYFSECSRGEANPYNNRYGFQAPYLGKAYVGFFSGHGVKSHNAGELYTELVTPLMRGQRYKISFRYSLADKFGLYSRSLGCAFSENFAYKELNGPLGTGYSPLFKLNYSIVGGDIVSLADDKSWSLFEKEFIAGGGERFLYISSVPVNGVSCAKVERNLPVKMFMDYAYYYIDDVVLVEQNEDGSYPVISREENRAEKIKRHFFANLYFETGSYEFLDRSIPDLTMLVYMLVKDSNWSVHIQGHTDPIGSEKDNLVLSANRANAVKEYLVANGIESGRIETSALGSISSSQSNASEDEKAKNRRVEILLLRD